MTYQEQDLVSFLSEKEIQQSIFSVCEPKCGSYLFTKAQVNFYDLQLTLV